MKRGLMAMPLLLAIAGCGGGLPHSSAVSVTVTPTQVSVKVGATILLTGEATGFTGEPLVSWWIQESKNIDFNNDCGKLDTEAKDFGGCPFGFVMYRAGGGIPASATYFAGQTAGTYHVTLTMTQVCCWFDSLTKTATAEIVVSE